MPLRLFYSPCPNDTFIFYAWVKGLVPGAPPVREILEDIDTLNTLALRGEPDVAKVSFHAFGRLQSRYALLHSGGAMGRGVGPLLVARGDSRLVTATAGRDEVMAASLAHASVAIPGALTTAALLVQLFAPEPRRLVTMPFDRIMPAVAAGEVDAGVIIHEGRFTYAGQGLVRLADLGEWWERTTGCALPLGAIVVRRDLGTEAAAAVDEAIRASLLFARASPEAATAYVRLHAQEMDPEVCRRHIDLYVNDFSLDYGPDGETAIRRLLEAARRVGALPASSEGIFWDD